MRLREQTRKRLRTRERNAPKTTATPEVEDSGQSQDARNEPESQILSEAQPGVQPHHQLQQIAENTTHSWFSVILNSPATITSDYSIQPLADNSGHTCETSQVSSPLQASLTASPCSTNELPRRCDLLTAGDDTVRLASELDYPKEAAATVQHSGHPVTALPAVVQSIEGEVGPKATKPDSSGQSIQPTEFRRRFRPRNAIKLPTASPSPPRVTIVLVGRPTHVSSDGIQSSRPRASWPDRDRAAIHISGGPSGYVQSDSPAALSDDEDARTCTTLAGEEDRRSLTPAPPSGRAFRRAHKQGFEGDQLEAP